MLVKCLHGFFIFQESAAGDISRFVSLFEGLEIVARDDYYTFADLLEAPDWSIEGLDYVDTPATETFHRTPWETMRVNEIVYDFQQGLVVPISTITQSAKLYPAANYYLSDGLILPGSLLEDGTRVTDYACQYLFGSGKFRYSEVISG
jgi:hypothetical protein